MLDQIKRQLAKRNPELGERNVIEKHNDDSLAGGVQRNILNH